MLVEKLEHGAFESPSKMFVAFGVRSCSLVTYVAASKSTLFAAVFYSPSMFLSALYFASYRRACGGESISPSILFLAFRFVALLDVIFRVFI